MKNGEYARTNDYEYSNEPYYHCCIPAELFENTVRSYFNISLDEFRKRASYNEDKGTYPWQDIDGSNIYYFPSTIPEVTDVKENSDGSITLTVYVMCLDKQTDCLFIHEVTIMPLADGGFKYLSNQVTYRGNYEQPSSLPRIEAQN